MSNEKKSWLRGVRDKLEGQLESVKTQQADGAAAAGNLVIQKSFGINAIAIYDGGYVRISKLLGGRDIAPLTPYEKLKSISYGERVQDRGSFKNAAYRLPGASKQQRSLDLTIATDRTVHTLTTEKDAFSSDDKAGRALAAAGQAVLDTLTSSAAATPPVQPTPARDPGPNASQLDPADQLKKLADLHAAGIITDDEFAAKKADLLNRM